MDNESIEILSHLKNAIETAGPDTQYYIRVPFNRDALTEEGLIIRDEQGREWRITASLVESE